LEVPDVKLKNKLILLYAVAALAAVLCVGAAVLAGIERLSIRAIERQLLDQSSLAEIYIVQMHLLRDDREGLLSAETARDAIGKLSLVLGHVRLYDTRLELLAAASTDLAKNITEDERLRLLSAAQKGDYAYLARNNIVHFASPVMQDDRILCIVEIIYPASFFRSLISDVVMVFAIGAVLLIVIMTGLSIVIAGKVTRPIRDLAEAAERYANREFRPVVIKGSDELVRLGESFNAMGAQLQEYIQRQKQFVSNVSHELRTPLTAIIGYSEILWDEMKERSDLRKAISHLNREAKRLAGLVDEVLTLSRMDSGKETLAFSRVDLSGLVAETAESMRLRAEKYGIILKTFIETGLTIWGDREKLIQVMVNLLDNAFKYSPAHSSVSVRLEREDGHARITVADEGIGIPEADREKVFERFYRADNVRHVPGTGLGLSIVKYIIDAHQGTIRLDRSSGGGTAVEIKLPLI